MVHAQEFENVPCPFCGLLCDDLRVSTQAAEVTVRANGCTKSVRLFAARGKDAQSPAIDGKPATLDEAVARAAAILRQSGRPLLVSAGTDVAGMRALVELAELTEGVVDHANSETMFRNLRVLQDTGWISTTLTEIRNRADLLVVAGGGIDKRFPRFFERCFSKFDTLFDVGSREIIFLGAVPDGLPAALKNRSTSLPVDSCRLAELFAALRALLAGRRLQATSVAGISIEELAALVVRMRNAKYGVLAWAAAEFDFPHADLAVQAMCDLVRELNARGRFAVFPLGGSDGDLTAMQVTTWQTGFPVRVDFRGGLPAQDPRRNSPQELLDRAEVDALVFVSSMDAGRTPPPSNVPTIVLGRAGMHPGHCSVFIPVAVPGIHHSGHFYRTDSVVSIRMRKLVASMHPPAAEVLQRILDVLRETV